MVSTVYADGWGSVIDHDEEGILEIVWLETTANMSGGAFNEWLAAFAGLVEEYGRTAVLVDSTSFMMDMSLMDADWRDANIIPRYNDAGVEKFAFLMPAGMPLIGTEPAAEGPADFLTGYFGGRDEALAWLVA